MGWMDEQQMATDPDAASGDLVPPERSPEVSLHTIIPAED